MDQGNRFVVSCVITGVLIAAILVSAAPALAQDQASLEGAIEQIEDGRYQDAVETLTPIVEEDPERVELHRLLGVLYLWLSDLDKAEYFMQRAVSIEPDNAELQYDLAVVHVRRLRYSRAVIVLDRAERLAKGPTLWRILRLRGVAQALQRQWSPAIKDLRRAMKHEPDAGSLVQLGRAHLGTGENRKALEAFRHAYSLDPGRGEAYRLASVSLVRIAQKTDNAKKKLKLYEESLGEAEGLLTVQPMSWTSWYQAGRAAIGARQMDKAEDFLRQVVAERPDYCYVWFNIARIYQTEERWEEALDAIEEAQACAPHLTPSFDLDDLDSLAETPPWVDKR